MMNTPMDIVEAMEVAGQRGFSWVAVDSDGDIFAYYKKPVIDDGVGQWIYQGIYASMVKPFVYLGDYNGSIPWDKSLTEVN